MTRLPIRCVWIATGNNPEFSNEMARRLVRIRLDARVDQPWRRSGFPPPRSDGLGARQPRAAGDRLPHPMPAPGSPPDVPRGTRTIGSYEDWAQVMGGVLEVAGVEGFLGNLDEMMEASDGEGAVWRGFVPAWWDRFGTAEVGTGDLYELALACEPPLPLGSGNDRSQRTRLGKALGRMRDRVFDIAGLKARVCAIGVLHQARRWALTLAEHGERGEHYPDPSEVPAGERETDLEQRSPKRSPAYPSETEWVRGRWGTWGTFFQTYAHARAHIIKKKSTNIPHLLLFPKSRQFKWLLPGNMAGNLKKHAPHVPRGPDAPDWLKEVP